MSDFQPGILAPIPAASRYLSFRISHPEHAASVLAALRDALDGVDTVIGLGPSLVQALDRKIDGLKEFPELSVPGAPVPSTPAALWVWLRADDLGAATVRSRDIERLVAPAFELDAAANAFRYADDRDLSGYEDGTENPEGDEALEVAFVSGKGAGLDGASFVAVQQWVHDFGKMREIPGDEMDRVIGRRKDDNEELEDAPAYAHVKRTEQESFKPEAKVLRRSSPWADERRAGLYFVAFGHSFRAFEVQMRRMIGATDGVHDGLFRFTQPITGSFFWCPPVKAASSICRRSGCNGGAPVRERADARAAGEAVSAHVRDGRVGARWGRPRACRWRGVGVAGRRALSPRVARRCRSRFIGLHRGSSRAVPFRSAPRDHAVRRGRRFRRVPAAPDSS
ncbi:hypothetical protein BMMON2_12550 [Burkholderia mallei]